MENQTDSEKYLYRYFSSIKKIDLMEYCLNEIRRHYQTTDIDETAAILLVNLKVWKIRQRHSKRKAKG